MTTILTLDEAVDLSKRGCELDYQSAEELLDSEEKLRKNIDLKERNYDSIIGNRVYAIRRIGDKFQYKHLGCLYNHPCNPRLGKFLEDYNELEKQTKYDRDSSKKRKGFNKLVERHLRLTPDDFFGLYGVEETTLEHNCITPQGSLKLVFNGNEEKFKKHLEERRRYYSEREGSKNIDYKGYSIIPRQLKELGEKWYLGLLGMHPSIAHCSEFCFPNPDFFVVWKGCLGPEFVRELAQPKDIGNGVVVMSRDKIPKYFQRVWNLKEEQIK